MDTRPFPLAFESMPKQQTLAKVRPALVDQAVPMALVFSSIV